MSGIAIFDSGVGGLSIYQNVREVLPDWRYIFVSDNEAYPYGTKSESELKRRVVEVVDRLIQQYSPDLLIIACNTASTVVLPLLRARFALPIVGVVPAIKPAARLSKTHKIGLLATPATIKRAYTDQLIRDFAGDCEVVRVGSGKLVQLAEDKLLGLELDLALIKDEIAPFLAESELDTLVLACTHFPLLNKEIRHIFNTENHPITLVDSGKGIANRVTSLTRSIDTRAASGENVAVFTVQIEHQTVFGRNLQTLGFDTIDDLR